MLSTTAPQVDTGGRYFFSRKKKSTPSRKIVSDRTTFDRERQCLPMTSTTAGTPCIETSIQVGILNNCGASDEEVTGPVLSGATLAMSGTISPGARRIKPHCIAR